MTGQPVVGMLPHVYELLKSGELEQANREVNAILQRDLENDEVLYALTGINYWTDKQKKAMAAATAFEKGESLIAAWKSFVPFMEKQGGRNESVLYAFKHGIFTLALGFYQSLFREDGSQQDPELYRKIGLCYKSLGDYEKALHLLEQARDGDGGSPAILAELADCYALFGEVRSAKVLFREAFFLGADKVELCYLESEIIHRLVDLVSSLGYAGNLLLEWIPVYGVLYGVLNVKRELRALEFGKLKQTIFSLESELRDSNEDAKANIVPRLINRYFWLIDHYVNVNDDKARINEVLLKIKLLDMGVYAKYTI